MRFPRYGRALAPCAALALALPLLGLNAGTASAATDLQAEDATLSQGTVATNHTGFTGSGFVDYTNVAGSYVEFT
ncbi:oxidoreductase, partial [Streptomyces sp. NPDC005209]